MLVRASSLDKQSAPGPCKEREQPEEQRPAPLLLNGKAEKIMLSFGGDVDLYEIESLCCMVGWPRRPLAKLATALENSYMVATLRSSQQDELVGFARVTSDHAFNATIWDLLIHPRYRGRGFGKSLVAAVVRALLRQDIDTITLFAHQHAVEFYRKIGFRDGERCGVKAMCWCHPHC